MAHGWWGNLVGTRGPGSLLCSESLAQYGATIAIESMLGEDSATEFMRFSRHDYIPTQSARGYFEMWRDGTDTVLSAMRSGGTNHDLADAKGHWVYHMLRRRVGDEVFFDTLRGLIRRYADSRMSLNDVRAAFIKAAPDKDLERFFGQWLDQKGAPILSLDWKPKGENAIEITIRQKQPGKPYQLWLDLGVTTNTEVIKHRVVLEERVQTFELPVKTKPEAVVADPDNRLLIWKPDYGDNPLNPKKRVSKPLTAKQLQMYVGDYEVEGMGTFRFSAKNGKLIGRHLPGTQVREAMYLGDHKFKIGSVTVEFKVENGRATSFEIMIGSLKKIGKRKTESAN